MKIHRTPANPIITPASHESIGGNINGPSLIQTPAWLPDGLGKYYLYFAHHQGEYIRLAYADDLTGPWRIHAPGALQLGQTPCHGHIASPDVHIDEDKRRIIMYYHGPVLAAEQAAQGAATQAAPIVGGQRTLVAASTDGVNFTSGAEILGNSYFRVFRWQGWWYALGMPGVFYRSRDGFTNFEHGPTRFTPAMRHAAVQVRGETLFVFYSNAGDCPEHILCAQIDLRPDWREWQPSSPVSVLRPERDYEGADLPCLPSQRGAIHERAHQLRDPGLFVEDDRSYLIYSVAGEAGLALAEIEF